MRIRPIVVTLCLLLLLTAGAFAQAILHVGPGQTYGTIQSAIDAASAADTVLVAPGTYQENLNFNGKAITVTSSDGAGNTVIDGGNRAAAVMFVTGETRSSVLSGFTIQHGGLFDSNVEFPGGIYFLFSSATLRDNIITQNACWSVYINESNPLIQDNEISATQNPDGECSLNGGAAVLVYFNLSEDMETDDGASALIVGNTIENNVQAGIRADNGSAGITVYGGSPVIINNIIRNNSTQSGNGGAINVEGGQGVAIVQNLIYGNSAGCGGGALALDAYPDRRTGIAALVANNTIVDNIDQNDPESSQCQAIAQIYPAPSSYGNSLPAEMVLNNVISGATSYPAVNCSETDPLDPSNEPAFGNNILYNGAGAFFGSYCVDVSNSGGNINADPQFKDAANGDYHLLATSPAVDHGQDSVVQALQNLTGLTLVTDFDGNPRVQDIIANGCLIDIGAYEYPGNNASCGPTEFLVSSLDPSTYAQAVTFTATLTSSGGVPTGNVAFSEDDAQVATQAVSANGTASYTTSELSVGNHVISAAYQPTGPFASTSASLIQVVYPYTTSTKITCSPSKIQARSPVLLNATVTSPNGTPPGEILFTDTNLIATQMLLDGKASFSYTGSNAGENDFTAFYPGSGPYLASQSTCSVTALSVPSQSVLTVSPQSTAYGAPVTLTATITAATPPGPATPTGSVLFYSNDNLVGIAAISGDVATLTLNQLPGGSNMLGCDYDGDEIYGISHCNTVVVSVAGTASSLSLTSSSNPDAALAAVTFTAKLTVAGQSAGPGNVIQLTLNGQTVSLTTDATGSVSYSVSNLVPGSYPVTASFSGSSGLLASTASLTEIVVALPTTTGLAVSPNPAYVNQAVTLTATVVSGGAAPVPGSVTFYDGLTVLNAAAVSSAGVATYVTSSLTPGTHILAAIFQSAGPDFLGSNSGPVNEVILASGFTIGLSPGSVNLTPGQSGSTSIQLVSDGNFTGPLALSWGTPPSNATISVTPATVNLAAAGTGSATLTVNTLVTVSALTHPAGGTRGWPAVLTAFAILLVPLGFARRKKLPALFSMLLLAATLAAVTGCTNDFYTDAAVAPGTYQLPVIATDVHGNSQTAILKINVTSSHAAN